MRPAGRLLRSSAREDRGVVGTFADIREKVATLDRLDSERRIFASRAHQYRLNPRLTLDQVKAVERRIGVRLPTQYRAFVTELGDGGPGPGYGVYSLEQALRGEWTPERLAALACPFPTPTTVTQVQALPRLLPGLLSVCSVGCGGCYCLVLAGSERGRVWVTNPDNDWSPAVNLKWLLSQPEVKSVGWLEVALRSPIERRLEFVDWFEDWLDESLQAARSRAERAKQAEPGDADE